MAQWINPAMMENLKPFFITRGEKLNVGSLTFSSLRIGDDPSNYADLSTDSSGNLTIAPTGDLKLAPVGGLVLPGTPYAVSLGDRRNKFLTVHAAELNVQTLVAESIRASVGGALTVTETTELITYMHRLDTTMQVKHNVLGDTTGEEGDYILLNGEGNVEWMQILVHDTPDSGKIYATVTDGYEYKVTRNLDSSGQNNWQVGDAVVNTGQGDDGFIEIHSGIDAAGDPGPSMRIQVRPTVPADYTDYNVAALLGNMDGAYGYSATTYGLGLGLENDDHIVIDPTNGIRFRDGSNLVHAQLTGSVWTIGEVSKGNVKIEAGKLAMRTGTIETIVMESDGDVFIGRDLSAPGTTFFSLFANNQTYNTESVTAGDLLIGDNTTGKSNILYDHSAGQLLFRGGKTTNIYIDTDGSLNAGSVKIDSNGITVDAADEVVFQSGGSDVAVLGVDTPIHSLFDGLRIVSDDAPGGLTGSAIELAVNVSSVESAALTLAGSSPTDWAFSVVGDTGTVFFQVGQTGATTHDAIFRTPVTIIESEAADIQSAIRADASQSANLAEWQDSSGGMLAAIGSGGSLYLPIETVTASPTTLDDTHHIVLCDCTSNDITVKLPAVSGLSGLIYHIKKIDSTSNIVSIDPEGSETLDGELSVDIISQYDSLKIACDGTEWHII